MGTYSGFSQLTEAFWSRRPHVLAYVPAQTFIEHIVRDHADATVASYANVLELFLAHCASADVDAKDARISQIDAFFNDMQRVGRGGLKVVRLDSGDGLSRATLALRATVLKVWYDFLVLDRCIERSPFDLREDPRKALIGNGRRRRGRVYFRREHKEPWIPTEAEFTRLMAYVRNPLACTDRDRFMAMLSYECALRASELVALCVEDFDFERMLLNVRDGKGGKPALLPFSPVVAREWPRFVADRGTVVTGGGRLFVSTSNRNYGQPLRVGTWNDRIESIRAAVGLPLFHPHTFRHMCLTDLARVGMSPLELKAFARHEDFRTTQIYIHMAARDLTRAFARADFDLRAWRSSRFLLTDGDDEQ